MINTKENEVPNTTIESKRKSDVSFEAEVEYEDQNVTIKVTDELVEWSERFLMDRFMQNPRLAKIYRENYSGGTALCGDEIIFLTVPIVNNEEVDGIVLTDEDGNEPFHFGTDTLISLLMLFGTYEVLKFKKLNAGNPYPKEYEPLFNFLDSTPDSYRFLNNVYVGYGREYGKHQEFRRLIEKYFGPLPSVHI